MTKVTGNQKNKDDIPKRALRIADELEELLEETGWAGRDSLGFVAITPNGIRRRAKIWEEENEGTST